MFIAYIGNTLQAPLKMDPQCRCGAAQFIIAGFSCRISSQCGPHRESTPLSAPMLSVVVLFAAPCAAFLAPGGVQVPVMRARSISMQEEAEAEPEPVAPPPAPTPVAAVAKKAAFGQDGVDYENTAFFKLCLASQKKLEESASADLLLATKNIAVVLMPLLVTMVLVAVFEVRSTRCACRHAWLSE